MLQYSSQVHIIYPQELELGLAARPCETRRETRPRDHGLVSQARSREKFETYDLRLCSFFTLKLPQIEPMRIDFMWSRSD